MCGEKHLLRRVTMRRSTALLVQVFGFILFLQTASALLCYVCNIKSRKHSKCNEHQPKLCDPHQSCATLMTQTALVKKCATRCPSTWGGRGDRSSGETCETCKTDLCNHGGKSGTKQPESFPKPTVISSDLYTYTLIHEPLTYWEATQRCLSEEMILATIQSEREQRFLELNFDAAPKRNRINFINGIWIGARSTEGNAWIWTEKGQVIPTRFHNYSCSSSAPAYQNWQVNHPKKFSRPRDFCGVFMWTKLGRWESASCGIQAAAFLCQRRYFYGSPYAINFVQSTVYNDSVYIYHSALTNASTSREICIEHGAQLVNLNVSAVSTAVLERLAFSIKDQGFWSEQDCSNRPSNVAGISADFAPIQPCSTLQSFICERPFHRGWPESCLTTTPAPTTQPVVTTALETSTRWLELTTTERRPPDSGTFPRYETTTEVLAVETTEAVTTGEKARQSKCAGRSLRVEDTLTFPAAELGTFANSLESCPTGRPMGNIFCSRQSSQFDLSTLAYSPCNRSMMQVKTELQTDNKSSKTGNNLEKYSSETRLLTTDPGQLSDEDIVDSVRVIDMLDVLAAENDTQEAVSTSVLNNVVATVDNLQSEMSKRNSLIGSEETANLAVVVENFASRVILNQSEPVYKMTTNSIQVEIIDVYANSTDVDENLLFASTTETRISVDHGFVQSLSNDTTKRRSRVLFIGHKDASLFPSQQNVSTVITATVLDGDEQEVSAPVVFSMQRHNYTSACTVETCSFYVPATQSWSSEGCSHYTSGESENSSFITCQCNHTTSFAVVVSLQTDHYNVALEYASEIGLAICVAFLVATVALFLTLPELRRVRSAYIHMNLCVCLSLAYTVFLLGVELTNNRALCVAVATSIHYFLLSAWGWMVVESVTMYRLFVTSFERPTVIEAWKVMTLVYTIIAAIVGTSLGGSVAIEKNRIAQGHNNDCENTDIFSNYVGYDHCWLTGVSLYLFIGMVGCLLVINMVLAFLVIKALTWGRRKVHSSTEETPTVHVLRAVLVAVLLGLTWVFAIPIVVSRNYEVQLVFAWVFAIFTSVQGLFIFYFFCLRREDVRRAWTDPLLRVICGATRKRKSGSVRRTESSSMASVAQQPGKPWRRFTNSLKGASTTTSSANNFKPKA